MKLFELFEQTINQNQAGIRRLPISPKLYKVLQYAATKNGVDVDIFSGGQRGINEPGSGGRTGSTRHDRGNAADLKLAITDAQGNRRILSANNPQDRPIMLNFVKDAASVGASGIGFGEDYMGPESLHVGFGNEATWGAKGRSANARKDFKKAFYAGRQNQIDIDDAIKHLPAQPVTPQIQQTPAPSLNDFKTAQDARGKVNLSSLSKVGTSQYNMRSGDSGDNITQLQSSLKSMGYNLANSGSFDDATNQAVRQFQQDFGLKVDGIAGNQTMAALNKLKSLAPAAPQSNIATTTTPSIDDIKYTSPAMDKALGITPKSVGPEYKSPKLDAAMKSITPAPKPPTSLTSSLASESRSRPGRILNEQRNPFEGFVNPVPNSKWSDTYGASRAHSRGSGATHKGTDMTAPRNTPVHSAMDGTIIYVKPVGHGGSQGNSIAVRHADGIVTKYFHLNAFAEGLKAGDTVKAGQVIGLVGNTGVGKMGTGARDTDPHLHFEIHRNVRGNSYTGQYVNPAQVLQQYRNNVPAYMSNPSVAAPNVRFVPGKNSSNIPRQVSYYRPAGGNQFQTPSTPAQTQTPAPAQIDYSKISNEQQRNAAMVYGAFRTAGFSDNQSRILTSEISGENNFRSKLLFGTHQDSSRTNLGMLSWNNGRGDPSTGRMTNLLNWMKKDGVLDANGNPMPTFENLVSQAKFLRHEMETIPGYSKTKTQFLDNPDVDPATAHNVLGKNFIGWRMSDPRIAASRQKNMNWGLSTLDKAISQIPNLATNNFTAPTTTTNQPQSIQRTLGDFSSVNAAKGNINLSSLSRVGTSQYNIRSGSSGDNVTSLQNRLKSLGYNIKPSGTFDAATKSVVSQFQRDFGLQVDGIVGNQTMAALNHLKSFKPTQTATPPKSGVDDIKYTSPALDKALGITPKSSGPEYKSPELDTAMKSITPTAPKPRVSPETHSLTLSGDLKRRYPENGTPAPLTLKRGGTSLPTKSGASAKRMPEPKKPIPKLSLASPTPQAQKAPAQSSQSQVQAPKAQVQSSQTQVQAPKAQAPKAQAQSSQSQVQASAPKAQSSQSQAQEPAQIPRLTAANVTFPDSGDVIDAMTPPTTPATPGEFINLLDPATLPADLDSEIGDTPKLPRSEP